MNDDARAQRVDVDAEAFGRCHEAFDRGRLGAGTGTESNPAIESLEPDPDTGIDRERTADVELTGHLDREVSSERRRLGRLPAGACSIANER